MDLILKNKKRVYYVIMLLGLCVTNYYGKNGFQTCKSESVLSLGFDPFRQKCWV